jgi:Tol biopolymer transport system component
VGETLPVQADGPASRKDAPGVERAVNRFVEQLRKNPRRRFADGDTLGLYVMDLGKKDVTLIASEVDEQRAYCGSPQWSNDGRRILFDASPGQEWTKTRLQMLESTEQGLGLSSFGFGNCPTLSPDGSRIAFLLNEGAIAGAKQGLYVMNADGTGRRWLDGYGRPRFAPDGKHLLSVSFSNPAELSLIGTETAASRSLELPGHQFLSVPSWTAPHQLVSVVRAADRTISIALLAVKEPAEVKIEQVLWKRGDGATVEPLYPVYSAKTKRCIFVGREPQGQSLYAVEAGKRPERLEADRYDGKIASLALSPDGQCLLFASDRP